MASKPSTASTCIVPIERIADKIYLIRGMKVMLDADLANLYEVPTKVLNQAIRRNQDRFPDDFMFRLSGEEAEILRSQIVTSTWGGRRFRPYAFTEHGVAMLSSVLRSKRAVQMNILIIRAFVRIRELLASNKDLAARVEKLEASQQQHASVLSLLAEEINRLTEPSVDPTKGSIGFRPRDEN